LHRTQFRNPNRKGRKREKREKDRRPNAFFRARQGCHSKSYAQFLSFDRAELAKAIRKLEPGDVMLVTRLDRLARSTRDLLNVLATIGKREAGFRSLKDS